MDTGTPARHAGAPAARPHAPSLPADDPSPAPTSGTRVPKRPAAERPSDGPGLKRRKAKAQDGAAAAPAATPAATQGPIRHEEASALTRDVEYADLGASRDPDGKHRKPAASPQDTAPRATAPAAADLAKARALLLPGGRAPATVNGCIDLINRAAGLAKAERNPVAALALLSALGEVVARMMATLPPDSEWRRPLAIEQRAGLGTALQALAQGLQGHPSAAVGEGLAGLALGLHCHRTAPEQAFAAGEALTYMTVARLEDGGVAPAFARSIYARLGGAALDDEGFRCLVVATRAAAYQAMHPPTLQDADGAGEARAQRTLLALLEAVVAHAPAPGGGGDAGPAARRVAAAGMTLARFVEERQCAQAARLLHALLRDGTGLPGHRALAVAALQAAPDWRQATVRMLQPPGPGPCALPGHADRAQQQRALQLWEALKDFWAMLVPLIESRYMPAPRAPAKPA